MFKVTITDPAYAGGKPIALTVPRTGIQVEELRKKYARVDATPTESQPPIPQPMPRLVALETGDDFHKAIAALVRVYTTAKKRGDLGLAQRAKDACAALLGAQPFLKGDDGKPFAPKPIGNVRAVNHTLAGIGRAK